MLQNLVKFQADLDDSGVDLNLPWFSEDDDMPATYRDMATHVANLRIDAIVSAGLNIARR